MNDDRSPHNELDTMDIAGKIYDDSTIIKYNDQENLNSDSNNNL